MLHEVLKFGYVPYVSRMIDIGSGTGYILIAAAATAQFQFLHGIDVVIDRVQLANNILQNPEFKCLRGGSYNMITYSAFKVENMAELAYLGHGSKVHYFTHIYCWNAVFSEDSNEALCKLLRDPRSQWKVLACSFKPASLIAEDVPIAGGYTLLPISQRASGEGHTMYIYRRRGT